MAFCVRTSCIVHGTPVSHKPNPDPQTGKSNETLAIILIEPGTGAVAGMRTRQKPVWGLPRSYSVPLGRVYLQSISQIDHALSKEKK